MQQSRSWKGLKLEAPATYRIRVQGHLGEEWTDRMCGMVITSAYMTDNEPVTILVGHLSDQAALSGVLNTLYELHLPLLSVEYMDEK